MTAIKITSDEQWHELRSKHIGGSEVAALFGASPYTTPYQIYQEKKGNWNSFEDSAIMELGRDMEPIIAKFVSKQQDWELVRCQEYLEHPEHKHLGCTLDYYVIQSEHGEGILEIKNVSSFSPDWQKTRAPDYVEWQLQQQLLVANASRVARGLPAFTWGAIASMHSGNPEDIRIMMRKPDEKAHKAIIKRSTQFWQDMQDGIEPPIMGGKDYECLVGMFKQYDGEYSKPLDWSNDNWMDEMLARYKQARETIAMCEKESKAIKADIMAKLMQGGQISDRAHSNSFNVYATKSIRKNKARPASQSETLKITIKEKEHES